MRYILDSFRHLLIVLLSVSIVIIVDRLDVIWVFESALSSVFNGTFGGGRSF